MALTDVEINYLEQFLDAHDRAGFYIAYNAFTSSENALLPGVETDYGKREASLQAKISTFSEATGAVAFLANRILQERNPELR